MILTLPDGTLLRVPYDIECDGPASIQAFYEEQSLLHPAPGGDA